MDTKARSKPMRNILNRLMSIGNFEAILFGDKVILDEDFNLIKNSKCYEQEWLFTNRFIDQGSFLEPIIHNIENWPACDFLIAFFSTGFPLQKAIDYVKLRKPVCVNDVSMQQLLLDRRCVMKILDAIDVPTPRRLISQKDDIPQLHQYLIDHFQDTLNIDFSEKGFSSEIVKQIDDDNIQLGNEIMKKPFVEKPVSGEDHNINIYFPASAGGGARCLFRKIGNKSSEFDIHCNSIRMDGSYIYEEFMNVDNSEDVKVYTIGENFAHAETRKSPVVDGVVRRNSEGKEVRYITNLTLEEKEVARKVGKAFGQYVCGFDLLRVNGKSYVIDVNGWSFVKGNDEYYEKSAQILSNFFLNEAKKRQLRPVLDQNTESQWKLKAFLSILRHGDRTPKQKLKFNLSGAPFINLLQGKEEEVVLKGEGQLQTVIEACKEVQSLNCDDVTKVEQVRSIIEAKLKLSGTKVQIKPQKKDDKSVQFIVKWGGEFTHGGRHQSKDLGENLRKDLKIINKKLLENVKTYTSSERRVIATAEIFAKAFLASEDLPSESLIITKEMLDDSNAAKEQMEKVKQKLHELVNSQVPSSPHQEPKLKPFLEKSWAASSPTLEPSSSLRSLQNISMYASDPGKLIQEIADYLGTLRKVMRENFKNLSTKTLKTRWCCSDSPNLFVERWEKVCKDYCDVEPGCFEPSKVSELYDSVKYDLLHNRDFLNIIFSDPSIEKDVLKRLYHRAKLLFDLIAPQEYGIEPKEKLEIGMRSSSLLLKQLISDLQEAKQSSDALTRLYFTKESKVICLLNIVMLCGLPTKISTDEVDELDYLTQITFELYERVKPSTGNENSMAEYSLRIGLSAGAHDPNLIDLQLDSKHSLSVAPRKWISDHISLDDALAHLNPNSFAYETL